MLTALILNSWNHRPILKYLVKFDRFSIPLSKEYRENIVSKIPRSNGVVLFSGWFRVVELLSCTRNAKN